ncbi:MAG: hypothetical protein LBG59_02545 [Candidatus Peribacteria bacterium]|nr:hypothetical protein [Candidatus Peribacteria bacterium]
MSVNIDTITETFSINSLRNSPVVFSDNVIDIFKKSAANPDKEITINAQLTPNVIFDHGLDIPCENSRIQDIEIVDDGGL